MRILLILFLITLSIGSYGQEAIPASEGINLFHREKHKTKIIPIETKVVMMISGVRIKGKLESIDDEGLSIDGVSYRLRDVEWIGLRSSFTRSLGIGLGVLGLGIATAGTIYVAGASGAGFVQSGLITLAGVGIGSLGFPLYRIGKMYRLDSDWKLIPPSS